jgi:hypothetical protein
LQIYESFYTCISAVPYKLILLFQNRVVSAETAEIEKVAKEKKEEKAREKTKSPGILLS